MIFGKTPFEFNLINKYIFVFGSFFEDIIIKRTDPTNQETANIKVPLEYAPKDKMFVRLNSDPDLNRPYSALLPRISFEIASGGIRYAPDRKLGSMGRHVTKNTANTNVFNVQYNPVPYDITFNVFVYAKNLTDGNKIVEQIVPFFTPDYTVSIQLVPEMNETRDVATVIQGVNYEDKYDGEFKERRFTIWSIQFVMHAWFFGPIKQKPMIKFIILNTRLSNQALPADANTFPEISNTDPIVDTLTLQPGLTANGQPTSNVANSVDYHLIAVDDNWGIAETFTVVKGP